MSDPTKKVKKIKKEPPPLDYSKFPDDVWEKTLVEFIASMNDIEQRLALLERQIGRLTKTVYMAQEAC